jgi:predicted PurR-regulated permease PerM
MSEEYELTESSRTYTFDNDNAHQLRHRKLMRLLIVIVVFVSFILIIQVGVIICGVYAVNTFVSDAQNVLQDWDHMYKDIQSYLPQIGSLFNFTQEATQFMKWAEVCIKAYGFCAA